MTRAATPLSSQTHVLITGGSSGLGLDIARLLVRRGVRVTLLARDPGKLSNAAADLIAEVPTARVQTTAVDVCDATALRQAIDDACAAEGLDILITSAGIMCEGYFEEISDHDFRQVMDINLFGTVNAVRAALPHLRAGRGRIVAVASVAGLTGVFGYTPYCAAKHALVGFTESLRYELEPMGVGVTLTCPGEFDSPMVDALERTRTPENRNHTLTIPKLPVRVIASEIVDGIAAGKQRVVPGRRTRAVVTAQRLLPSISQLVARRRIAAVYQGPERR